MIYKVGVDLDGVCRNFIGAMTKAFTQAYPELAYKIQPQTTYAFDNWPFKEIGIDPWEFMKQHPKEVFSLADPIPGAISAVEQMVKTLEPKGHQIIICSHQSPDISRYSWLWLYLNQVPASNVIFVADSRDKWKHVDIMIDDSPHVLAAKPTGKIAFKVNHTYNKDSSAEWSIDHIREFLPIFMSEYENNQSGR